MELIGIWTLSYVTKYSITLLDLRTHKSFHQISCHFLKTDKYECVTEPQRIKAK